MQTLYLKYLQNFHRSNILSNHSNFSRLDQIDMCVLRMSAIRKHRDTSIKARRGIGGPLEEQIQVSEIRYTQQGR